MSDKYDKICAEIAKAERKLSDLKESLKGLYERKTEIENLEIVNTVRSMVMDKTEIMAFLATLKSGKGLPKITEAKADD